MTPVNMLVGDKLTGTVTKCIVTGDSNPSKTKSTTGNKFFRGISLGGKAANQPSTQFDHEGARGDDGVIPQPPTGNINKGAGVGAINQGEGAASIINHQEINFKLSKEDFGASVPSGGSINKGPGAGGVNCGQWSASIIKCKEPINF